jgi:hypothetical protein
LLVQGLFADASCWSDVIGALQASGLDLSSVQNSLTAFEESVDAVRRVLARTEGPTVLASHSFAGTIISEIDDAPNVSALVYIATRAPDAGEDYAALGKKFASATAGIVFDDEGRLSERAFLRNFACDGSRARARVLYVAQHSFRIPVIQTKTTTWPGGRSPPIMPSRSGSDDRSRSSALHGQAHGRAHDLVGASHLSMISHACLLARLIEFAARGA